MDRNRRGRKRRIARLFNLFMTIFLCLVALSALTSCIVLMIKNHKLENRAIETMAQVEQANQTIDDTREEAKNQVEEAKKSAEEDFLNRLKAMMESGDGTSAMLRSFYPGELVVADAGRYYFFPISDSLKHHGYQEERFVMGEDDILEYQDETGQAISRKGIDVSKYQEKVNWKKVASDGVDYAFIRVGIRGATEGGLIIDDMFERNIEGALDNGIDVGAYFFTQAVNEEEAVEEAHFVLDALEPYPVSYPVVLDVEQVAAENSRTADLSKADRTKAAIAFCETIREAGYTPMIYGNLKTFLLLLDMEQLEPYEKWFAYYQTPLYFPYDFSIWQYTSEGVVDGVDGPVDLNVSMKVWE